MVPSRARLPVLVAALLAAACSNDESSAPPPPLEDAGGQDADASAADVSVSDDAEAGVPEASPEAGEDGAADGSAEAEPDSATDASTAWAGPPWYGCTEGDTPATATVVTAFDLADQYFNPEDRRTIDAQVDFPAAGTWERIDMRVELSCPADGDCDNWDRFANLMLVDSAGTPNESITELERYITPYNVGMCMLTDVTRFAPRLVGTQTVRSFIDTWVGPDTVGHGHGWRVTVKFIFHPGTPDPQQVPDEMIQLWPYADVEVGNPDAPFAASMGVKTVDVPAGVTRAEVRVVATGHGQGNASNCAEFCHLVHDVDVNGTSFTFDPWRNDCDENPIGPTQAGTWKFGRAGWCPGAYVLPQVFDVTDGLTPGSANTFSYDTYEPGSGPYENTCRPGAGNDQNVCTACAFDSTAGNCDYNGGDHTMPVHRLSVQLLLYK